MSGPVLSYLLGDPWTTGPRLLAGPALRAEAERRRGPEVLDAFLELTVALRRFELVSHVRDRIVALSTEKPQELDEEGNPIELSPRERAMQRRLASRGRHRAGHTTG